MKELFNSIRWVNSLTILLFVFGLVACAKPTVVIRKTPVPVKKEEPVVVKKEPVKEEEPKKEEIPVKEEPAPTLAKAEIVIAEADTYMGTPHRMGGLSKSGIDCSGLVVQSYKKISVPLPRSTRYQIKSGKAVPMANVQKGDLVFFTYPGGTRVTHVGLVYEVNGPKDVVFIHTSSSKGVRKDNLYSNYWKPLFLEARRVID